MDTVTRKTDSLQARISHFPNLSPIDKLDCMSLLLMPAFC